MLRLSVAPERPGQPRVLVIGLTHRDVHRLRSGGGIGFNLADLDIHFASRRSGIVEPAQVRLLVDRDDETLRRHFGLGDERPRVIAASEIPRGWRPPNGGRRR